MVGREIDSRKIFFPCSVLAYPRTHLSFAAYSFSMEHRSLMK